MTEQLGDDLDGCSGSEQPRRTAMAEIMQRHHWKPCGVEVDAQVLRQILAVIGLAGRRREDERIGADTDGEGVLRLPGSMSTEGRDSARTWVGS